MDHHRIYISCQAIKLPVSSHPLPFPIFSFFLFPQLNVILFLFTCIGPQE
jgi:hypothetical protein